MEELAGTKNRVIHNREVGDAMFMVFGAQKVVDEMFQLEIVSNFTRDYIVVGNTVHLYINVLRVGDRGKRKSHWLSGKWLVHHLEHFIDDNEANDRIKTRATLIRPSFVGNDASTSLTRTGMMYEA
jgi:hypothetical protein